MEKVIDPSQPAHAKYSASGSKRWIECPGSMTLYGDLPEPPEGPWAKEGTRAHSALEVLLSNRDKWELAVNWIRKKYPEDMVNHVYNSALRIMEHAEGADKFLCETRVDSSGFTAPKQFGTVDAAAIWYFDKVKVYDFKYGAGVVVDVEDNSQLIYYGLGIFQKYLGTFDEVEIVVDQPRAYHKSGKTFRSATYTAADMEKWATIFREGVKRIEEGDDTLKAGSHCQFCKAQRVCKAYKGNRRHQTYSARPPIVNAKSFFSKL